MYCTTINYNPHTLVCKQVRICVCCVVLCCVCVCVCVRARVRVFARVRACLWTCMCACVRVCACMCVCTVNVPSPLRCGDSISEFGAWLCPHHFAKQQLHIPQHLVVCGEAGTRTHARTHTHAHTHLKHPHNISLFISPLHHTCLMFLYYSYITMVAPGSLAPKPKRTTVSTQNTRVVPLEPNRTTKSFPIAFLDAY